MRLSAGPHLVQVKAHYQRIEAIGTRVLWGTAGSASRDLLRFGAPPAAAPEG
jgi:hypothetical protein